MIQLNYRDTRPIYEQVRDGFRHLIVQGVLRPEDKLPSVREMATKLTINPNTIQRAYRELEQNGWVYTIPGKGCFVCGVPNSQRIRVEELYKNLDEIVEELLFLGENQKTIQTHIENSSDQYLMGNSSQSEEVQK